MMTNFGEEDPYIQFQYLFSLRKLPKFVEKSFRCVIFLPLFLFNFFLGALSLFVEVGFWIVVLLCRRLYKESIGVEKFEVFKILLKSCNVAVENWKLQKGVVDMEKWAEINRHASPKHITKLLSDVPPSRESSYSIGTNGQGIKISSFHLILLIEIAKLVQTPNAHDKVPLRKMLDEVFEIIHFIDNKLNVSSSTSRLVLMMARVIHQYGGTSGLGEFVLIQRRDLEHQQSEFRLRAKQKWWACNKHLMGPVLLNFLHEVTSLLNDLLQCLSDEPSEVVYGRIEQLFVELLVTFLAQLPAAIYKNILDSPVEEYKERVRQGLGFICKLEALKSHMSFSLPHGSTITYLFDTQTSPTSMQVQGGQGTTDLTLIGGGGEIQDGAQILEQQV